MKEEKKETKGEGEKKSKAPKKHLHSIRTEIVRDHKGKVNGYVSHHAYKAKPTDHYTEPERPMATHSSPEEAGEHVTEHAQMAEGMGGGQGEEEAQEQMPEGQAEPEAGE